MKVATIALATVLAVSSTAALAQTTPPATGQGVVTAPSIGAYQTTVGVSNSVPTWKNTQGTAPPKKPAVVQNQVGRLPGVRTGQSPDR